MSRAQRSGSRSDDRVSHGGRRRAHAQLLHQQGARRSLAVGRYMRHLQLFRGGTTAENAVDILGIVVCVFMILIFQSEFVQVRTARC